MKKFEKSIELGGRKLTLSTGTVAEQADGAILASYGETVVLATVVASPMKEDLGYFPLGVEYQERLYAGGRIKGSRWVKREGKPSDDEILKGRLIDRSIRPLFPKEYKKEVQVVITVLSVDLENDPIYVAPIAASAAIAISSIPWEGPVGVVTVGKRDGTYFVNPTEAEKAYSDMDLVVSSTRSSIVMVEAGAREVSEKDILGGIVYAQKEAGKLIDFIEEIAREIGSKKEDVQKEKKNLDLTKSVRKLVDDKLPELVRKMATREGRNEEYEQLKDSVKLTVGEEQGEQAGRIFEELYKEKVRDMIFKGKRPDGRKLDQIREISVDVGILPRTHGSAIFKRGTTQVLTVTTLGSPSMGQLIETAEGEEEKRYIHHYSMPPYSMGETGRMGWPSRREVGHGALAERSLMPVIPSEEVFPYAIRVVSEVLSSNGSTSMASACGSTLSLMDSGVPITSPVSGIAMGLIVKSEKEYTILSDISGIEDFNGDMDFKVAGTKKGITALQLDVKTLSLGPDILGDALEQAKKGREEILEKMLAAISEPRAKVSTYAPKIKTIKVGVDKIGEVIGPGGRVIRKIIAETGAQVDVEDDGTISISGVNAEAVDKAEEWIKSLTHEVTAGEIYKGVVKRIQPFGAFVEILPGKDGLVHVSDMEQGFVKDPSEVVALGDEVEVRVKQIDDMGRINLSMILDPSKEKERRGEPKRQRRDFKKRSSDFGPHFPTSRLLTREKKGRFGR